MYSISELLTITPLFKGLNQTEIGPFAAVCTDRVLRANAVLFNEGDPGGELFMVAEGILEVHKPFIGKVNVLEAGAYLGDISLLDGAPRTATVIALTNSRVMCLAQTDFDRLCAEQPAIGYRVLRNIIHELVARLLDKEERLADLQARLPPG
jgi:CRP-like cAMP-binding protein